MKSYQLGEFEEVVMLTIAVLDGKAYSVAVKDEIESRLQRSVSMGALHTALNRLEEKGYLKATTGEANEDRAGRPKRYFELTAAGKKALRNAKAAREQLWKAIPKTVLQITQMI